MEARKVPELLQTPNTPQRLAWAPMGGMLSYLGETLKEEREARGVILAEIVATLKQRGVNIRSDGPLSRFERDETTPRNLDEVVQAYADVLGMDWHDLWKQALKRSLNNSSNRGLDSQPKDG